MSFRLIAALFVAVLFGLAQLLPWSGATVSRSEPPVQAVGRMAPSTAFAQDEEDEDDEDDDDEDEDDDDDEDGDDEDEDDDDEEDNDEDEEDSDNDDADEDDSDNDDADEDDSDNDDADADDGDNTSVDGDVAAAPPPPAVDATLPATEATGTSNGGDVVIRLGGERVVVSMFPWMPNGVTLVVKRAEPTQVAAVPGSRAGDLLFTIEAKDATGKPLTTLPGEVNLSIRYNEEDVSSLTESNLTISRLNPTTNQWSAAPKQAKNAEGNYIAASIIDPGTYTVHTP